VTRVLLVLSAPAAVAEPRLREARARWPGAECTVLLRASQEGAMAEPLAGCTVIHDKPGRGVGAFLRELRRADYDHGVILWTGQFNYWPAKVAFLLARVRRREVATERGTFAFTWPRAVAHAFHRAKRPEHASFGMPPGIPWPLAALLAALRATVGRAAGALFLAARRLAPRC
jgi:hypothetical protein